MNILLIGLTRFEKNLYEFKLAILYIVDDINIILSHLKEWWFYLEPLFFLSIRNIGEQLISMRNRPAQLGLLLVEWANWGLDLKVHSLTRKQFISTNNTQKEWGDYWSKIRYNLAINNDNIKYLNYVKSKPRFIPVVFPLLVSPGDNKSLFIWVLGDFKDIGSFYVYFRNKVNMSQFSYLTVYLKNITDKINSFELEIQVNSELTGENVISVKQKNTNGKPFEINGKPFEFKFSFAQWFSENFNPVDNDMQVFVNTDSEIDGEWVTDSEYELTTLNRGSKRTRDAEGDTDFEWEPSTSNKGKERALEYTGNIDSDLHIRKKRVFDNITSDQEESHGENEEPTSEINYNSEFEIHGSNFNEEGSRKYKDKLIAAQRDVLGDYHSSWLYKNRYKDNVSESNLILDKCIVENEIVDVRLIYVIKEIKESLDYKPMYIDSISGSRSTKEDKFYPWAANKLAKFSRLTSAMEAVINHISISVLVECALPYEGRLGECIVDNYFDRQDVAIEDTFDRERVVNLLKEMMDLPDYKSSRCITSISGTKMVKDEFYKWVLNELKDQDDCPTRYIERPTLITVTNLLNCLLK
jgi:hypothetical protein